MPARSRSGSRTAIWLQRRARTSNGSSATTSTGSRPEVAAGEWERIVAAGLDEISFAWAGPEEPGQGHYYAVRGPRLLIEYDNTQNGANHIHAVWRDLDNDWGEDLLARHYATAHSAE